jgi:hypothetical protein
MAALSLKLIKFKQVTLDNTDIFIQFILWVSFGTWVTRKGICFSIIFVLDPYSLMCKVVYIYFDSFYSFVIYHRKSWLLKDWDKWCMICLYFK